MAKFLESYITELQVYSLQMLQRANVGNILDRVIIWLEVKKHE